MNQMACPGRGHDLQMGRLVRTYAGRPRGLGGTSSRPLPGALHTLLEGAAWGFPDRTSGASVPLPQARGPVSLGGRAKNGRGAGHFHAHPTHFLPPFLGNKGASGSRPFQLLA